MATTVKFDRQYTGRSSGNVFMRFVASDGRASEVIAREGRHGLTKFTRAEARHEAMRRLGVDIPCPNGCGGRVVPGAWIDPDMACPVQP